ADPGEGPARAEAEVLTRHPLDGERVTADVADVDRGGAERDLAGRDAPARDGEVDGRGRPERDDAQLGAPDSDAERACELGMQVAPQAHLLGRRLLERLERVELPPVADQLAEA